MNNAMRHFDPGVDLSVLRSAVSSAKELDRLVGALERTDLLRQVSAAAAALREIRLPRFLPPQRMVRDWARISDSAAVLLNDWRQMERLVSEAVGQIRNAVVPWVRIPREKGWRDGFQSNCVLSLAEHGWFVVPDRAWTLEIVRSRGTEGVKTSEWMDTVASAVRERCSAIEEALCAAFPGRSDHFRDAFQAHREGRYRLSVPVFLIQVDGIWEERFGRAFYEPRKWKECHRKLGGLRTEVGAQLSRERLGLWLTRKERPKDFSGLNRYRVLHGEDLVDGTERNSLQAIALLEFVSWLVSAREVDEAGGTRIPCGSGSWRSASEWRTTGLCADATGLD